VFLNRCEGWRASEARQGQYGTKFQTYQNAIEKIWHMKAQHEKAEPWTKCTGSASTGAEPRGMGGYPHPDMPDLGQPPSHSAPLPGSTTYKFHNRTPTARIKLWPDQQMSWIERNTRVSHLCWAPKQRALETGQTN